MSFTFRLFNFVLWHFMVHKSKEAIKKRRASELYVCQSGSLVPVLRIRRVEHAIKIPIAVCPPTRRHSGSREAGEGEQGETGRRVCYCFVMLLHAKFIVDFIFNVVPFTQHIFRFRFYAFLWT